MAADSERDRNTFAHIGKLWIRNIELEWALEMAKRAEPVSPPDPPVKESDNHV